MSVKIDPSGRRWVQAEVEVPGTPEQVWQAIAAVRDEPLWQEWVKDLFPAVASEAAC